MLPLGLIEMVSQNDIHKIGLSGSLLISCPLDQHLVVVGNNELLILFRKCPGTYIAVQTAASTGAALDVVALFTERLPVAEIVRAVSGAGNFVVGTEPDIRLLSSAGGTPVVVLLFDFPPLSGTRLRPWLALLADLQTLKLVTSAFFDNRGKTLLALQFPHATENVLVRCLSTRKSERIHCRSNLGFRKRRARNTVSRRPKRAQYDSVIEPVRDTWRDKVALRFIKPSFTTGFRFVWRESRSEQQALACTRTTHNSGRP